MELTVTQENLNRALSAVGRVASTKTQLPILSNILLRTDGNRLLVAATNLEIASTQYIGAKVVKTRCNYNPRKTNDRIYCQPAQKNQSNLRL
jgi:DNA polymerase III sliding clamp (beta) subunit (PCNA family)